MGERGSRRWDPGRGRAQGSVSGRLSLRVLVYKMGTKVRDFYEDYIDDLEFNNQLITLFFFFNFYLFIYI